MTPRPSLRLGAVVIGSLVVLLGATPSVASAAPMGDREMKIRMIDQLPAAPQVLLLGSSRVLKYSPIDIAQVSSHSAFNAGVSSGRPVDAWKYLTHTRSRFPNDMPHLVWGIEVEQFRPMPGEPGAAPLQPTPSVSAGAPTQPLTRWVNTSGDRFTGRGFREWDFHDRAFVAAGNNRRSQAPILRRRMREQILDYRQRVYNGTAYRELSPYAKGYTVHVLRLANEQGDEPVIFLSPTHDIARRDLGPRGFTARRRDLLAWLASLQRNDGLRFTVIDLTAVSTFRGVAADFYDGIHMRVANTRRVLSELNRREQL